MEDLRQADLSHLHIREMTPEQRDELRRRYREFVSAMTGAAAVEPRLSRPVDPVIRRAPWQ